MMPITLMFQATFSTDYHFGTGSGLGEAIDSALRRDSSGRPEITGPRIKGRFSQTLFRYLAQIDAFAQLRRCQRSGDLSGPRVCVASTPDPCVACRLFGGSVGRARDGWTFGTARLISGEPEAMWQPGRDGARSVTRTAYDVRTRRAEERKLFTREVGSAGATFSFACSTDRPAAEAAAEAAMLYALARWTRDLGAGDRRMLGIVDIQLLWGSVDGAGVNAQQLRDWFGWYWLKGNNQPAPRVPTAVQPQSISAPFVGSAARRTLVARAESDLMFAQRSAAGNEFESLDHIPGPSLLGVLIARASRLSPIALGQLLAGAVQVTPLYLALPVDPDETGAVAFSGGALMPTIPAPLDLLTCKASSGWDPEDNPHGIAPASIEQNGDNLRRCKRCADEGNPDVPLKGVGGFIPVTGGRTVHTAMVENVHVASDPARGAGLSGDLFSYRAIAAGQYLAGEVTGPDDLLDALGLTDGSAHTWRLGKRPSAGYGECRIEVATAPVGGSVFEGRPLERRVPREPTKHGDRVSVTLVTPLIELDPWLRSTTALGLDWIRRELRLQQLKEGDDNDYNDYILWPLNTYGGSALIGASNQYAGLPRRTDAAMPVGAAAGFELWWNGDYDDLIKRIRAVESRRHGARGHEGFGMVVFNHPAYSYPVSSDDLTQPEPTAPPYNQRDAWARRYEDATMRRLIGDAADAARELRRSLKAAELLAVSRELHALAVPTVAAAEIGDALSKLLPDADPTLSANGPAFPLRRIVNGAPQDRVMQKRRSLQAERAAITTFQAALLALLADAEGDERGDLGRRDLLAAVADLIGGLAKEKGQ